jgi:release factor glutamine methyltransferase
MKTAPPLMLADALLAAHSQGLAPKDAQRLMLHTMGRPMHDRSWLLTHDQEVLSPSQCAVFKAACERALQGEPLPYIVGSIEFFGLRLAVSPAVLIPRPDTETLVEWALEIGQQMAHRKTAEADTTAITAMDLGSGSGAIALALKHQQPSWSVRGIDASIEALAVAQANASQLRLDVAFAPSHWLNDITGRFDLIVSNPPYIAPGDPHLAALVHEPLAALVAPQDGLDDLRAIIQAAPHHLQPNAYLLLEHGYDQAASVRAMLVARGFVAVESRKDLAGIERCSGGRWADAG